MPEHVGRSSEMLLGSDESQTRPAGFPGGLLLRGLPGGLLLGGPDAARDLPGGQNAVARKRPGPSTRMPWLPNAPTVTGKVAK
eukprot:3674863-Alexandrium_andersonii.AAC.1